MIEKYMDTIINKLSINMLRYLSLLCIGIIIISLCIGAYTIGKLAGSAEQIDYISKIINKSANTNNIIYFDCKNSNTLGTGCTNGIYYVDNLIKLGG